MSIESRKVEYDKDAEERFNEHVKELHTLERHEEPWTGKICFTTSQPRVKLKVP